MTYSNDAIGAVEEMLETFDCLGGPLTKDVYDYRMGLLEEEFDETMEAVETGDAEGIVDGHIDLIVIAIGNLATFGVNTRDAFDRVLTANMAKVAGKRAEGDPEGVSLTKPEGWVGPDHSDNHGELHDVI